MSPSHKGRKCGQQVHRFCGTHRASTKAITICSTSRFLKLPEQLPDLRLVRLAHGVDRAVPKAIHQTDFPCNGRSDCCWIARPPVIILRMPITEDRPNSLSHLGWIAPPSLKSVQRAKINVDVSVIRRHARQKLLLFGNALHRGLPVTKRRDYSRAISPTFMRTMRAGEGCPPYTLQLAHLGQEFAVRSCLSQALNQQLHRFDRR